jgi:hypothetical protein
MIAVDPSRDAAVRPTTDSEPRFRFLYTASAVAWQ